MPSIRTLNEQGVNSFQLFLVELRANPTLWPPPDILDDVRFSQPIACDVEIASRRFASKFEFGRYIVDLVSGRVPENLLLTSTGLWTWLTLFYFEQLCPADRYGKRKILANIGNYILAAGFGGALKRDWHLLYFPWKMVHLHDAESEWMLGGELGIDTKVVREIANSYRRNVSTPFISLAKSLYYDDVKCQIRRGATSTHGIGSDGNRRQLGGNLRRLDRVMGQLDLTYDVFGMDATGLSNLLPKKEFGKWLPKNGSKNQ